MYAYRFAVSLAAVFLALALALGTAGSASAQSSTDYCTTLRLNAVQQRIKSGAALSAALMEAALGAAQKAMFKPGQTSLGYDPMADALHQIERLSEDALTAAGCGAPAPVAPTPRPPPPSVATQACEFKLGFGALRDQIAAVVGSCAENERWNTQNGDSLQKTSRGLMVWRKADNFTAFTDGHRSWVSGPFGVQQRLNTECFAWEAGCPGR